MLTKRIKELYQSVPAAVRSFLLKAILLFVVWQTLFYFVLGPTRVPDKALTNFTCASTIKVLSLFYEGMTPEYIETNKQKDAIILQKNGQKAVAIGDACNAFDIMALYVGFLICFPGRAKRKLLFMLAGIPCIYAFNIIRCAVITWFNIAHRGWADISHHYIFTTLMYVLVFGGWVLYTKKAGDAA